MLYSELKGWHWLISWDNAKPDNSKTMIRDLSKLGTLTRVQTKTTYILAPKRLSHWQAIRTVIEANLNPKTGNAVYLNLRSRRTFEYGSRTKFKWRKAV